MEKLKRSTKRNIQTVSGVIVFFTVFGILANEGVIGYKLSGLLIPLGIYMMLAVSLNLVVGVLGELSLGHAGFMCIGAYVGGLFSIFTQNVIASSVLRLILAMLLGAAAAALAGFLVGIPILRLRGDYLAIVTLGFGEIIRSIFGNVYIVKDAAGYHFSFATPVPLENLQTGWKNVFYGAQGITAPRNTTLTIVVIMLVLSLIVIMNFVDSKSGRACKAIRNNMIAADASGVNVTKYRLMAFVLSSTIAGIAGVLYVHSFAGVQPKTFDYNLSILVLVFVVLGGLKSMRGSLIATLILYSLPELLRSIQNYRMLIYAVALIAIMVLGKSPAFAHQRDKVTGFVKGIFTNIKGFFTKLFRRGGKEKGND